MNLILEVDHDYIEEFGPLKTFLINKLVIFIQSRVEINVYI